MPKRTIAICNPAKLSSFQGSLVIETRDAKATVPFEDIWVVVLESRQTSLSAALLSDLSDSGIGVIVCGADHMPDGLMLPLAAHSRHAAIVEDQLAIPKPLKKQLWKSIVIAKIENQAECLKTLGCKEATSLHNIVKDVRSGDTSNREAVAASVYFKACTPVGGRRSSIYTPLLDYGYSIIRAGIARTAVAGGWLVSRGVHHESTLNAFNLVDDLIEPFRPIVDVLVFSLDDLTLSTETKRKLVGVFECPVEIGGQTHSVQTAIDYMFVSLKSSITNGDAKRLCLPRLITSMQGGVDEG